MSKDYKVGQVLYVVPEGEQKVVPLLIVEEVTRKTVQGKKVIHMAVSPTRDKPFNVSKVVGELFDDLTSLHDTLVERATQEISRIIQNAKKIAEVKYGIKNQSSDEDGVDVANDDVDENPEDVIDFGDGTVARIGKIEMGETKQDLKA